MSEHQLARGVELPDDVSGESWSVEITIARWVDGSIDEDQESTTLFRGTEAETEEAYSRIYAAAIHKDDAVSQLLTDIADTYRLLDNHAKCYPCDDRWLDMTLMGRVAYTVRLMEDLRRRQEA